MGKYIYLLMGESGSGKTTICNKLAENDNYRQLWSYTTRKMRYPNEPGHIFVDSFPQGARYVAYTEFDGNQYWATQDQVDEADTYVVDPKGLKWFLNNYHGLKTPVLFYIYASRRARKRRMKLRGDKIEDIRRRIKNDKDEFCDMFARVLECDPTLPTSFIIDNSKDDDAAYQTIHDMIGWFEEGGCDTDSV